MNSCAVKWLLLLVSLVAIFLLSRIEAQIPYVEPSALSSVEGIVKTSGMVFAGKLCAGKCIKVVGVNGSGYKEITGQVVNRPGGETTLFVRRIG